MKRGTLLKVEWYDSASNNTNMDISECVEEKGIQCIAIGRFISDRKGFLKLATMQTGNCVMHHHIIPKGCIISKRLLKEGDYV